MNSTPNYSQLAKEVRRDVLSLIHKGHTSHVASCLSLTDIAIVLYENLKPEDEVIFSKGWASALYYILNIRKGKLNREEVFSIFPNAPYLALLEPPVHPVATGAVGHGTPFSVGLAMAKKMKGEGGTVYCILSDGELNEGTVWESVQLAKHHKLDNLVFIIDKNNWQAMGKTEDVVSLNIAEAFGGFGWDVIGVDGHDYTPLEWAIQTQKREDIPRVIVAHTIKGKGVSFMENHLTFHYRHVDDETYSKALAELQ